MADDVRLIDGNALVKTIESNHCKDCNNYNGAMCRACGWMDAMDYIEDAPAIEAEPVKHGKWSECWSDQVRNVISVICSECGNASITCLPIIILDGDDLLKKICIQMPYCPKCGARMEAYEDEQAQ